MLVPVFHPEVVDKLLDQSVLMVCFAGPSPLLLEFSSDADFTTNMFRSLCCVDRGWMRQRWIKIRECGGWRRFGQAPQYSWV